MDLKSKETRLYFPPKLSSINTEQDYVYQLLQLALANSESRYGKCSLHLLDNKLPLKRIEHMLGFDRGIDIGAFTVTEDREQRFLPIRIPISKGLRGYRVSFIKKGDQTRFDGVNQVRDLKNFTAGQGDGWADSKIFKYNNLPVVEAGSINTIIDMLSYQRFDYFPRGALESVFELDEFKNKPVELESNLLLIYPSLTVFYVNKDNKLLRDRLEFGLNTAIDNGQFEQFFNSHPISVEALTLLNLDKRKKLFLCNPYLPKWVPLMQDKYWLQPWPEHVHKDQCS